MRSEEAEEVVVDPQSLVADPRRSSVCNNRAGIASVEEAWHHLLPAKAVPCQAVVPCQVVAAAAVRNIRKVAAGPLAEDARKAGHPEAMDYVSESQSWKGNDPDPVKVI